jgi:hypothetical protein
LVSGRRSTRPLRLPDRTFRSALWGISGVIPDTSLDAWNDAPGRTQEDTLQMLGDAENTLNEHPQPNNGSPLGG